MLEVSADLTLFTQGIMAAAPHGERKDQRDQENADRVVPVEKLETVVLDAFIGVGPRAPADCARNHHQQRNG